VIGFLPPRADRWNTTIFFYFPVVLSSEPIMREVGVL
jgi:hypothetical protein